MSDRVRSSRPGKAQGLKDAKQTEPDRLPVPGLAPSLLAAPRHTDNPPLSFCYWIRGSSYGAHVTYVGGVRDGVEFPSARNVEVEGDGFWLLIDMLEKAGYSLVT